MRSRLAQRELDHQLRDLSVPFLIGLSSRTCKSLRNIGLRIHRQTSGSPKTRKQTQFLTEWVSDCVSQHKTHDRITSSSARRAKSICSSRTLR